MRSHRKSLHQIQQPQRLIPLDHVDPDWKRLMVLGTLTILTTIGAMVFGAAMFGG